MKLHNTRILKQIKASGEEAYYPQYQSSFLGIKYWCFFDLYNLPVTHGNKHKELNNRLQSLISSGKDIETAKKFIDTYITFVNDVNASKIKNKVIKEEFIKYP